MIAGLERLLFATRWLLVPFYFALAIDLFALIAKVVMRLYSFVVGFATLSESGTILGVLGVVDLTLTASLIVIVIFSAPENRAGRRPFVQRDFEDFEADVAIAP